MVVSAEEFEQTEIKLVRSIRAEGTETYLIEGDDLDMGQRSGRQDRRFPSRLGRVVLQFVPNPPYDKLVHGTIILTRKWEEEAVSQLVYEIDNRVVDCFGGGLRHERSSFEVDVFTADDTEYYAYADVVEDDSQRGIYGIYKNVKTTQQAIEDLPDSLSRVVEEMIDEQYNEIEEIIRSDMESDEKKQRVLESIEFGLERGLPTAIYRTERSSKSETDE